MRPYEGEPPFHLVQLSKLPPEQWVGKPVFHPMEQHGDAPSWIHADWFHYPTNGDEYLVTEYDVGIVAHFEGVTEGEGASGPSNWEVHFLIGNGLSRHYPACTLWVPITRQGERAK